MAASDEFLVFFRQVQSGLLLSHVFPRPVLPTTRAPVVSQPNWRFFLHDPRWCDVHAGKRGYSSFLSPMTTNAPSACNYRPSVARLTFRECIFALNQRPFILAPPLIHPSLHENNKRVRVKPVIDADNKAKVPWLVAGVHDGLRLGSKESRRPTALSRAL